MLLLKIDDSQDDDHPPPTCSFVLSPLEWHERTLFSIRIKWCEKRRTETRGLTPSSPLERVFFHANSSRTSFFWILPSTRVLTSSRVSSFLHWWSSGSDASDAHPSHSFVLLLFCSTWIGFCLLWLMISRLWSRWVCHSDSRERKTSQGREEWWSRPGIILSNQSRGWILS